MRIDCSEGMKVLMDALIPIPVSVKVPEKSSHQILLISNRSSLPSKKTSEMIRRGWKVGEWEGGSVRRLKGGRVGDGKISEGFDRSKIPRTNVHDESMNQESLAHETTRSRVSTPVDIDHEVTSFHQVNNGSIIISSCTKDHEVSLDSS